VIDAHDPGEQMEHFLLVKGKRSCWAIPSAAVLRVWNTDDWPASDISDASEILDLDVAARPTRIIEVSRQNGEAFGLLAFGNPEIAEKHPDQILAVPELLKRDPAGRLVMSVVTSHGIGLAWVLDIDQLRGEA
jgi:hypothetical protein